MQSYDYVIVGSGLFGAVVAHEMKKQGKKCLVIERRNHIGGNIYTEDMNGITVHKYGAHIFHTSSKKVWDYINQFTEFDAFINTPMAVYKDEIYNLPFNMNTFSKLWGVQKPHEAQQIIQRQIQESKIKEPRNLEEQAIKLVGKDIYHKLIKGYTEKQWGELCENLPPDIIKRIPVRFTYDNNYFNDKYQGIPCEGYTKIIERLLDGIEVRLNTDYLAYQQEYDKRARKIIFTGAIDEFYNYRQGKLQYRSLHFEHEEIEVNNYQGNAVMNFTEYEVPYTRIIEHKHFKKAHKHIDDEYTIITREYPCLWNEGKERYYPINSSENQKIYNEYRRLGKKEKNVIFGGRLGTYKYLDMDEVIEQALACVEKELLCRA